MANSLWKSGTASLVALGIITGAAAPMVMIAPANAQATFPDVPSSYWATPFIQELANRGIITGFPDGSFRPEEPVTRAQFAVMVGKAFNVAQVRDPINFADVSSDFWAYTQIRRAYSTGFMAGYPGNEFRPSQNIPRAQVLVSLTNGLRYAATGAVDNTLLAYNDASAIPDYARSPIAAATEKRIVVNYPNVNTLGPNETATRAEVAAFIYQALVSQGQVAAINSPYIVGQSQVPPQAVRIPAGTAIPVRYDQAERILLAKNEPNPSPLTLKVAQNVVTSNGRVLIPAGSEVLGELRIVNGGAQFFAREVVLTNGTRLPFDATSELITRTETVRKGTSVGRVLAGTVVGAGAAAGIAGVTGDRNIAADEVLGGAAIGTLAGIFLGRDSIDLIAVNPNTDLALTLNSDLVIQSAAQPR